MKSLCLPKVFELVKKYRVLLIIYFAIIVIIAVGFGYRKYRSAGEVAPDTQKQIQEYKSGLEGLDSAIAKNKEAISDTQDQIDKIQDYIDSSILMKLDADASKSVSLQYKLDALSEDSELENAGKAIKSYIAGGLLADVQAKDKGKENAFLNEVVTCAVDNPDVTINMLHYSNERINELQSIIDDSIHAYVNSISDKFGGIKLSEVKVSVSEKKNTSILEKQNKQFQQLKDAKVKLSDLKAKTATLIEKKTTYVDKTKPAEVETNPVTAFIKNFAAIVIIGIALLVFVFWMIITFGNIVAGRADIERIGIEVLGYYKHGKEFTPDAAAIAQNIKLICSRNETETVFVQHFAESEKKTDRFVEIIEECSKLDINSICGNQLLDSGEEIKQAVEAKCCLIIAESGLTKLSDVKSCIKLCNKFDIKIAGAVLV